MSDALQAFNEAPLIAPDGRKVALRNRDCEGDSISFHYAIGRNRFDAHPVVCEAGTLRDFAADVLSHRAPSKERAGYITAAYGGDGRRCSTNVLPRAWLALDVDGIDADALPEWRMYLTRFRGFGWPTASSTPEAPRERVIIELNEPVDRAQGIGIGALVADDADAEFGATVRIDRCTFRAEQPCFLPVGDVRPFYLLGDPLNVTTWLQQASEAPPAAPPATAEVAAIADARMRHVVSTLGRAGLLKRPLDNARGYAMRCPWEATHSHVDPPGSSATALLFPAEGNGWHGGFRCLHAHCAGRGLRDLLTLLRAAERMGSEVAA